MNHIATSDSLLVAHDGLAKGLLSVISEGLEGFMDDNPRYACPLVRVTSSIFRNTFGDDCCLLNYHLWGCLFLIYRMGGFQTQQACLPARQVLNMGVCLRD